MIFSTQAFGFGQTQCEIRHPHPPHPTASPYTTIPPLCATRHNRRSLACERLHHAGKVVVAIWVFQKMRKESEWQCFGFWVFQGGAAWLSCSFVSARREKVENCLLPKRQEPFALPCPDWDCAVCPRGSSGGMNLIHKKN